MSFGLGHNLVLLNPVTYRVNILEATVLRYLPMMLTLVADTVSGGSS